MNISCKGDDYCGEFGFALATLSVEFRYFAEARPSDKKAIRQMSGR